MNPREATSGRVVALLALLLSASAALAQTLPPPATRSTGIQPAQLGLIVNVDDPASETVGELYVRMHRIPAGNVVRVALGTDEAVTPERFGVADATVKARLGADVQALALAFRVPVRVGAYNSITSAFARGYFTRPATATGIHLGYQNPYDFRQNHSQPFTVHGIRPAMMVAGSNPETSQVLILRGAWAEFATPRDRVFAMKTSDGTRSIRTAKLPASQAINGVELRVLQANRAPPGPLMLYFQGLAVIPDLNQHAYWHGAWVDTLTSCAGMLSGCGGQTTVWQVIDAGATGSYGTVEEPYATTGKFPRIADFVRIYTSGVTLVEAAWRSVDFPYQGVFVGDPLAAPWAKP